MAYITTSHGANDTVYRYCAASDSVQRLRVIKIHATSTDASRYGSGEWDVRYTVEPLQADANFSFFLVGADEIHDDPRHAFAAVREAVLVEEAEEVA